MCESWPRALDEKFSTMISKSTATTPPAEIHWSLRQRRLSLQYRFCSSTLDIFLFQVYRDPTSSVQVEETWDLVHKRQPGVHHRPSWFAEIGGVGYLGSTEQQHQPSAAWTGQLHFHQVSGSKVFVSLFFSLQTCCFCFSTSQLSTFAGHLVHAIVHIYVCLCVSQKCDNVVNGFRLQLQMLNTRCLCVCRRSLIMW